MSNEAVSPAELLDATRQMAVLARLGFPLADGVQAAGEGSRWLSTVGAHMAEGDTLAQAVGRHPRIFSPFYRAMVEAAEVAEKPERVLTALSQFIERADTLQRNVRTTLFYPLLLVNAALLELILILVSVVPAVLVPLAQWAGHWTTADVLSHLSSQALPAALVIALLGLNVVALRPGAPDALAGRVPGMKPLQRLAQQGLWAQALGSLLAAGVQMTGALRQAATVVSDPVLATALDRLGAAVDRGDTLSDALASVPGLDPSLAWSVAAGERREDLGPLLLDAAAFIDHQVDRRMAYAVRMLEPWSQAAAGLVVCTVLLSFWAPFYTLVGRLH
ncbi:MAG TPA: type II secretion system F family protein [Candidatus Xenobia bacterium]|jgi:type II secretory pathway component PulF